MINIMNILTGWGRSMDLLKTPAEIKDMSIERLKICSRCPQAKESKVLMILKDSSEHVDIIKCDQCGCPCNEKSLVVEEKCPLNKWK